MSKKRSIGWLRNTKSIVLLGLENAGKTTLLSQWVRGSTSKTTTTIGLDIEHVEVGSEIFNLIDLGGQQPFRMTLWKTYAQMASAIIFVFDITDQAKTSNAVKWFWQVAEWVPDNVPIMFCANKIDLKKGNEKIAMSLEEIITNFNLKKFGSDEARHSFRIYEISALTGENVEAAMSWLLSRLQVSEKSPDLRKLVIAKSDGTIITEISFINPTELNADMMEINEILELNKNITTKQNTMQFYESNNSIKFLVMSSDYVCILSARKDADFNSVRIVAETILSMYLTQVSDGTFDETLFRELIVNNFGKTLT